LFIAVDAITLRSSGARQLGSSARTAQARAENLLIYGRYFELPRKIIRDRADQLLEFSKLTERADEKVEPLPGA
jgi:ABC-type polysaccharide/polyol phosphate transport system ATPase subunit